VERFVPCSETSDTSYHDDGTGKDVDDKGPRGILCIVH